MKRMRSESNAVPAATGGKMEKYKPINRRRMERVLPHIWDVTDLCDIIERHGNKTLFRYYEGKDIQSMTYATFGTQVREAAAACAAKRSLSSGKPLRSGYAHIWAHLPQDA